MFEDYLEDAYALAGQARTSSDIVAKKRYYRAAVLYSASAVEAFLNYVADTLEKGSALEPCELAFLADRRFGFHQGKIEPLDTTEYHRTEEKLSLLLAEFRPSYDIAGEPSWSHLTELRRLRDKIVHPRNHDDEVTPQQYDALLGRGLAAAIEVMDQLCQGVFGRRLRQRLRDLSC